VSPFLIFIILSSMSTNTGNRGKERHSALLAPRIKEITEKSARLLLILTKNVHYDKCMLRATGLAFVSLLSLVPLTAFIFSLFTGFGAFAEAQAHFKEFLIRFLIPTRQQEIIEYIDLFLENAGTLGIVGLLVFAIASIFLLNGITENINAVWGSSSAMGPLRKFFLYISILVFGTLLIGVGFTFFHSLRSMFFHGREIPAGLSAVYLLGPSAVVFLIIWLIIYTVPSTRVRIDSSLIGAFCGTLIWEIARFGFLFFTKYVIRLSVLYGSLASVPIFLIWLAIQWFVILLAVEISSLHQYRASGRVGFHGGALQPFAQIRTGLDIYLDMAERFYRGKEPCSLRRLAQLHFLSPNDLEFYLRLLKNGGLISYSRSHPSFAVISKEPAITSMKEVFHVLFGSAQSPSPFDESFNNNKRVENFFHSGTDSFEESTVLSVVAEISEKKNLE
jgi:membrane protein